MSGLMGNRSLASQTHETNPRADHFQYHGRGMIRAWYWKRSALGLVGSDLLDWGDSTYKRRTSNSQSAPWLWKWPNKPEVEGRFSDPPTKNSPVINSRYFDRIHVYWYVAHAHAARHATLELMCVVVNSAVRSGDSYYKTENADDGKAKSRDTRATNCEGDSERPANPFIFALPWRYRHLGFHLRGTVSFSRRQAFF